MSCNTCNVHAPWEVGERVFMNREPNGGFPIPEMYVRARIKGISGHPENFEEYPEPTLELKIPIISDGRIQVITRPLRIEFCPWCGRKL